METKTHPDMPDQDLHNMLNQWSVPPASPWLKQRAVNTIRAQHRDTISVLWTPRWLATAMSVAAMIGVLSGALLPANAADTDTTEIMTLLW